MYSRAMSELMEDGDRIKYCWIMLRPTPPPPTEGKNKMGRKSVAKVVVFREMNWCNFLHQFISIKNRIFVGEMEGDTQKRTKNTLQKQTKILYKNQRKNLFIQQILANIVQIFFNI